MVIPAVVWMVTHWLPACSVFGTPFDGDTSVVSAIVAEVLHLPEVVCAAWHTILAIQPHVVPGTLQLRAIGVRIGTHVVSGLSRMPPCMAVAPGTKVSVIASMRTSEVAHVVHPEGTLVAQQMARHPAVAPVPAISHVMGLTKVD